MNGVGPSGPASTSGMPWYNTAASGYAGSQARPPPPMSQGNGRVPIEDEEPLIQELGIDLGGVTKRLMLVLTMQAAKQPQLMAEADVAGALAVLLGISALHLFLGKLHFGVILGWTVVAALVMSWMFSLLAQPTFSGPQSQPPGAFRTLCILGYCLIPMVGLAVAAVFFNAGLLLAGIAAFCVLWSSYLVAVIFTGFVEELKGNQTLVMFPALLFYAMIAILTLYRR